MLDTPSRKRAMRFLHQSIRAVTKCHIGPTRLGNMLARWAQHHYAGEWSTEYQQDVITEHFDRSLRMRVNPTHHIGGAIYWRGAYARRILRCVEQFLQPHMVFADIGANQGELTLFAARRLTHGKVLAFEPTIESFERLTSNVRLNRLNNVVALNCCLGSERGKVELFAPDENSHHHRHGWNEGMPSMFAPDPQAIPIAQTDVHLLDDLLPTLDVDRLDVIKIDVEGAELDVLRGSRDSIQRFRPTIVVEINAETFRRAGYEPFDVCTFLQGLDYEGYVLDRAGNRGKHIVRNVPDQCDAVWIPN